MYLIKYFQRKKNAQNHKIEEGIALESQNISFSYGKKKVVDSFNFKFKKNFTYGILGPSGSGKSTLASHFNGLLKSNSGNIFLFNGQNIYFYEKKISNFKKLRKLVSMVLQFPEYQLFRENVLSDVSYGSIILGTPKDEAIEKSKQKLIELGITEEFFDVSPFLLSGGQKRKVALAGILVIDPKIIIFDEPAIGLDPASTLKIIQMIKELKKEDKTIIVISHNIDLVLELADELLIFDQGRLIMNGDPYQIFNDKRSNIGLPRVIRFIQKLTEKSEKFKYLWNLKPRNPQELSKYIAHAFSHK